MSWILSQPGCEHLEGESEKKGCKERWCFNHSWETDVYAPLTALQGIKLPQAFANLIQCLTTSLAQVVIPSVWLNYLLLQFQCGVKERIVGLTLR